VNDPELDLKDAAKRCSEQVNLHILAHTRSGDMVPDWGSSTPWVAIRLSDGGSDGILYDSKRQATEHQLHPHQCAYITVPPEGMTPEQARVMLKFTKQMYDAGVQLADPDMQVQPVVRKEAIPSVIRALKRGH
jgi:hypothetical protein